MLPLALPVAGTEVRLIVSMGQLAQLFAVVLHRCYGVFK